MLRSLRDDSDEKGGLMVLSHVKKKLTARTTETQGFHVSLVFYSVLFLP